MSSRCPVVRYEAKRVVRDDGKSLRFDVAPLLDAGNGSMYLVFRLSLSEFVSFPLRRCRDYYLRDDNFVSILADDEIFSSVELLFG